MSASYDILPHEILLEIFAFTEPHGRWKYSCRDALDAAIKNIIKSDKGGDDVYTDNIWMESNCNWRTKTKRSIKMSMKTTKKNHRLFCWAKHLADNQKYFNNTRSSYDLVNGAIISNKYVSDGCILAIIKLFPSIVQLSKGMMDDFFETRPTLWMRIILETDMPLRRNYSISRKQLDMVVDAIKKMPDDADWVHMFSMASYDAIRDAIIKRHPSGLVTADSHHVLIRLYIDKVDPKFVPADIGVLAKYFKKIAFPAEFASTMIKWDRPDIVDLIHANADVMPRDVADLIKESNYIADAEAELKIGIDYRQKMNVLYNLYLRKWTVYKSYKSHHYPRFKSICVMKIVASISHDVKMIRNIYFHALKNSTIAGMVELAVICRTRDVPLDDIDERIIRASRK